MVRSVAMRGVHRLSLCSRLTSLLVCSTRCSLLLYSLLALHTTATGRCSDSTIHEPGWDLWPGRPSSTSSARRNSRRISMYFEQFRLSSQVIYLPYSIPPLAGPLPANIARLHFGFSFITEPPDAARIDGRRADSRRRRGRRTTERPMDAQQLGSDATFPPSKPPAHC